MPFFSNAHCHTNYCDGRNTPEEMLLSAKNLGFVSLGFSSHSFQGFDPEWSMSQDAQKQYFSHIRKLQQTKDAAAPKIWLGLEEDGMTPQECREENRRLMDYIIVSTHYLTRDFHGQPVYVDGEPTRLRQYVEETLDGDFMAMVRQYYDLHVAALLSAKAHIIGHFDLVRKYAASRSLFDENSRKYRQLALDALERAYPCGGVLEINTGAMARGYLDNPYPTRELLGAWREMGGCITITSDCHQAENMAFAYPDAVKLAKDCGYRTALMLGTGTQLFEETSL